MTRIGVTGHIHLTDGSAAVIYRALADALAEYAPDGVRGVTCLAAGADQLFARAVLATGGSYEVVLPARDYGRVGVAAANRRTFGRLMRRASSVSVLRNRRSGHAAYVAASEEVLRRCDVLIAVWDRGGDSCTGTVAAMADRFGVPVRVIWPAGAARALLP